MDARKVLTPKVFDSMSHRKKVAYRKTAKTHNAVPFQVSYNGDNFKVGAMSCDPDIT